jgi:hypothetical protein
MIIKVHVMDPANIYHPELVPQRTGWHNLYGSEIDALNGNISRVIPTNIPQTIPSSSWQQDTDFCCGSSAAAIAMGMANDAEPHNWLMQNGYMTQDWGTEYIGIVRYLNTKGYSASYDGIGHDGKMSGSFYDDIINCLRAGYKVILVMHGTSKGCRNNYWTSGGHYIVLDGIDNGNGSVSGGSGSTGSSGGEIIRWQDMLNYPLFHSEPTERAQININNYTGLGIAVDGWIGKDTLRGMVMTIQIAINHDYNAGLVVDGWWGDATDAALGDHYIQYGENQEMVRAVQILLLARGYDPGAIDASCGKDTDAAIKAFQRDNGLPVDGVAGHDTIRKLLFVI